MLTPGLRLALFLTCFTAASVTVASAQSTPLTLGPLTLTAPPGWSQTSTAPVRLLSPDSTPQQFLELELLGSEQTTKELRERHFEIIQNLSGMMRPGSVPQNGVLGGFIWTKMELQRTPGQVETVILYSTKREPFYMAITARATRADLLARNLPAIEAMLRKATFSSAPQAPNSAAPAANNAVGLATLDEYVYTAPSGWATQRLKDAIMLSSPLSATNEKCLIYLLPMRPAGADLLQDANNTFRDAWRGFVPRNQTPAGFAFPESIVHGHSGQGWDYVIIRRGIAPPNSPESRLGFVMVAKLDNRLAVISGVSKDPLVSACMGENIAATVWPKFFYSLGFKNWPPGDQTQIMRKLLAGEWIAATATAADKITFAGNGRFANAAAAQQYHLTTNELITTTQAYFGNGNYTLKGNAITLTQDDKRTDHGFFRVEQESKDEGRTWAPVFYLLRTSAVDGQEYELKYKKP